MQQNSEVDINVLVNLYHTKLASALNQNVLLEAKLQTLKNDYEKEKQLPVSYTHLTLPTKA